MSTNGPNLDDIDICVIKTEALNNDDLVMVHQLFDLSYRHANHSYLEKSFSKLRYIALAKIGKNLAGYPNIDCEVTEQEWLLFKTVNRDRGDTLLGIVWVPDAPEGW